MFSAHSANIASGAAGRLAGGCRLRSGCLHLCLRLHYQQMARAFLLVPPLLKMVTIHLTLTPCMRRNFRTVTVLKASRTRHGQRDDSVQVTPHSNTSKNEPCHNRRHSRIRCGPRYARRVRQCPCHCKVGITAVFGMRCFGALVTIQVVLPFCGLSFQLHRRNPKSPSPTGKSCVTSED